MAPATSTAIAAGVVHVEVTELCARSLADAAAHDASDDDLALAAGLSATYRDDAGALLEAASREAAAHLRLRRRVAQRRSSAPPPALPVGAIGRGRS